MFADYHVHTYYSDDSETPMEKQVERAKKTREYGLDMMNHAIADGFLVANVYRLLEKEMIAFCNDEKSCSREI